MDHLSISGVITCICIITPIILSINILRNNISLRRISVRVNNLVYTEDRSPMFYNNFNMKTDP